MWGGGGDLWSREDERLKRQALLRQSKEKQEDSGGFFGAIGNTLENIGGAVATGAEAVGSFFGGMVE